MEYFAGLDVSLRSCAVCVVDSKGKVMLERELLCEVPPHWLQHRHRRFRVSSPFCELVLGLALLKTGTEFQPTKRWETWSI